MKTKGTFALLALLAVLLAGTWTTRADDKTAKPIPYPLETCAVCGMKLGGDMGKPYSFVYKGREIKVCDKSEEADFKKDPDKYLKDIDAEVAKLKAKDKSSSTNSVK
jgi:YHS domain-containing protein